MNLKQDDRDTVVIAQRWRVNVDKDWFQEQLRRRELTQSAVAARMEVDPATLSYAVNGTRELKVKEAAGLAEVLDVPVTEIMRRWGYEVKSEVRNAPIKFLIRDDMTATPLPTPFIQAPLPPGFAADGYAVRFQPTHGVGGFWDGMICFIEPGEHDPRDCVGRAALIQTEDERCLFGVLSRQRDAGDYSVVHPGQRNTIESVKVVRVNPATWFRAG